MARGLVALFVTGTAVLTTDAAIVDNFDTDPLGIVANLTPGTTVSADQAGLGGVVGGTRHAELTLNSGTGANAGEIDVTTAPGFAATASFFDGTGTFSITYDAGGAGLGGGAGVVTGDTLTVGAAAAAAGGTINLILRDAFGNTQTVSQSPAIDNTFSTPYSTLSFDFSGGAVDTDRIVSITLEIVSGTTANEIRVDFVNAAGNLQPIPEPSTWIAGIGTLGLLGSLIFRRKR